MRAIASLFFVLLPLALFPPTSTAEQDETSPGDTLGTARIYSPSSVIRPDTQTAGTTQITTTVLPLSDELEESGSQAGGPKERARGGGGGGVTFGYLNANFDALNAQISGMGIPLLSENLFLMGGRGYGRIGSFIIGGGGYGSWTETSGIPDCCSRKVRTDLGYGGLILGFNKGGSRLEGTLGALVGGGGIEITRRRNSRNITGWEEAWEPFETNGPEQVDTEDLNITSVLSASFFAVEPFFEIKAWVLPWMSIDGAVSYLWARVGRGQWMLDGIKIPDSPQTNLGGLGIRLTLNFGA
jgi:hypothetical protein